MLINRQLGDYLLIKRLATGGMAEIFLALKRGPGTFEKLVVLKSIVKNQSDNDLYRKMFSIEAEVAAWSNHPHVVQLYDVVELEQMDAMVLEYIPGYTLEELVEGTRAVGRPLPADLAIFLMLDVCEGLDHVHKLCHWDGSPLGIVHRDMSPQNVMVTREGHAKVFDFGIAFMGSAGHDELKGSLVGKYGFMSPELVRGEQVDARSDVWAVGAMLWELTVGQPMLEPAGELEMIRKITSEPITRPSEVSANYPRFLERIVMKALEQDRNDRYPGCAHLRADLKKYLKVSALKPDRAQVAEAVQTAFPRDIIEFHEMMRIVRADMPSMDDTQSLDIRALMSMLGEDSDELLDAPTTGFGEGLEDDDEEAEATIAQDLDLDVLGALDAPGPPVPRTEPPQALGRQMLVPQAQKQRRLPRGLLIAALLVGIFALAAASVAVFVFFGDLGEVGSGNSAAVDVRPVAATSGSLTLETKPSGASIYLDGRLLSVSTPVTIPDLEFDQPVTVTIEKKGMEPLQETVTLTRSEPKATLTLVMVEESSTKNGSGTLQVHTRPEDTTVFIDNVEAAVGTPATLKDISAGEEHALRVSKAGCEDEFIAFSLQDGEIRDLDIELTVSSKAALGHLSVASVPSQRRVTINGDFVGKTPFANLRMPAGKLLTVVVSDERLGQWQKRVTLKAGQTREIEATFGQVATRRSDGAEAEGDDLEPTSDATCTLSVESTPVANISINGRPRGRTPTAPMAVAPGQVVLRLTDKAKGLDISKTITLSGDETREVKIDVPMGRLVITSKVKAEVYVDNILIGTTPIKSYAVYAGQHRVRLAANTIHRVKELKIRISGGDTRRMSEDFAPAKPAAPSKARKPQIKALDDVPTPSQPKKKTPLDDEPYPLME